MNKRAQRFFRAGCFVLAGAFVSASVTGWASATADSSTTPASSVSATPTPTETHLEEDQPGWDCTKDGNKLCGPTETPWIADAWLSFDGARVAEELGQQDAAAAFRATYVGTYSTEPHWAGYVVVASKVYLGTFHVFKIDTGI